MQAARVRRVALARIRQRRREECGFGKGQLGRAFVEVALRSSFGTEDAVTPFGDVQVEFDDPPFRR